MAFGSEEAALVVSRTRKQKTSPTREGEAANKSSTQRPAPRLLQGGARLVKFDLFLSKGN